MITQLSWNESPDHPVQGVTIPPTALRAGMTYTVRVSTGVKSESVYEPWPGEIDNGEGDEGDDAEKYREEQERRVWALGEAKKMLTKPGIMGPTSMLDPLSLSVMAEYILFGSIPVGDDDG